MASNLNATFQQQLNDRRQRLTAALPGAGDIEAHLNHLLEEVDSALERLDDGSFGLCETCHDPIEPDRLLADPLIRYCIDHLNPAQQRSLQEDLDLTARIQTGLLPKQNISLNGWVASYRYRAAGPVSGDYCDLVSGEDGALYFMLGDVSGKGIAASMLMGHLHAMFRTLISLQIPLRQIIARANRLFCESTLPTHYATLVFGKALRDGRIELCNAGHLPPLVMQEGQVVRLDATGLPIGLFCSDEFATRDVRLKKDGTMLLYTDGLAESRNRNEKEFGISRLIEWAGSRGCLPPEDLLSALEAELELFQSGVAGTDDLSLMAIQRVE